MGVRGGGCDCGLDPADVPDLAADSPIARCFGSLGLGAPALIGATMEGDVPSIPLVAPLIVKDAADWAAE